MTRARIEYATRGRPAPSATYGVTVMPSNSTGRNGSPSSVGGGTGCRSSKIMTLTAFAAPRALESASCTDTCHIGRPLTLSRFCTGIEPFASKSRTGSTSPVTNAPSGKTCANPTARGVTIAICSSCLSAPGCPGVLTLLAYLTVLAKPSHFRMDHHGASITDGLLAELAGLAWLALLSG